MLSTIAFTCLTFCTGALSWFGVLFVERALKVRKEHHLDGFDSDIREEEYKKHLFMKLESHKSLILLPV